METFLNYIGDNYDKVKRNLLKLCNGFNEELFDEDIFHDTIIKIDKHLGKKLLNDCEYEKYMCKSFRTNLVREKLYHRNSKTDHMFDFSQYNQPFTKDYVEHTIDFNMVLKLLNQKFGLKLARAYIDWLSGYNIKEVMIKYEIDSGYYWVKKITNFIRGYYKNKMMIY